MRIFLILLCSFYILQGGAQSKSSLEDDLYLYLGVYRGALLAEAGEKLDSLNEIFDLLDRESADLNLIGRVLNSNTLWLRRQIKKNRISDDSIFLNYGGFQYLQFRQVKLLLDHLALLSMIAEGAFERVYPYHVRLSPILLQELRTYELQKSDRIGEVGAGSGGFGFMLGMTNIPKKVVLNELPYSSKENFKLNYKKFEDHLNYTKMDFAVGSKRRCRMGDYAFDKLILRNTFHHFSHPKNMSRSMRYTLRSGGELFVMETKWEELEIPCQSAMPFSEIIRILEQAGFEYIETFDLEGRVIMRFIIFHKEFDDD